MDVDDIMKKRLLFIFYLSTRIILILYHSSISVFATTDDEICDSKKIISVVYDDSGSICGE